MDDLLDGVRLEGVQAGVDVRWEAYSEEGDGDDDGDERDGGQLT